MDEAILTEFYARQNRLRREEHELWRIERYLTFWPEPDLIEPEWHPMPEHWDEGQLAENELPTWSDWQAIEAAHAQMRAHFPRMTPAPQTIRFSKRQLAPSPMERTLQPVNLVDPVSRTSSDRGLATIQPARLLTVGAVFVGPDANHAVMVHRHLGPYFVAFFDSGVGSPWLTRLYEDKGYAVDAITARQLYYFER